MPSVRVSGWWVADIGFFSSFVPGLFRSMPDMPRLSVKTCNLGTRHGQKTVPH